MPDELEDLWLGPTSPTEEEQPNTVNPAPLRANETGNTTDTSKTNHQPADYPPMPPIVPPAFTTTNYETTYKQLQYQSQTADEPSKPEPKPTS